MNARAPLLAKVHIAKKELGLDDDTYRDLLDQRYGRRSAARLSDGQLIDLVGHFKAQGFRPKTSNKTAKQYPGNQSGQIAKVRALWRAGYDLGLVRDPGDRALNAFVARTAQVAAANWLQDARAANKVVEGLKSWLARDAGVDWNESPNARISVVRAAWRRLGSLGQLRIPNRDALDGWASRAVSPHATAVEQLSAGQLDAVQKRLGAWLRRALREADDK